MSTVTKEKTLKIRLTEADDWKIRAAAEATHTSVTDFVMRPALIRADEVLVDFETITLPPEQFELMLTALDEPPRPIPALVELARQPRRFARV